MVMTGMQIQHQAELTKVVLASFVIYVPDMFNFTATSWNAASFLRRLL